VIVTPLNSSDIKRWSDKLKDRMLARAIRSRTLVAQGYRADVDHPPEYLSAVSARGIDNQQFFIMVKLFGHQNFWTFIQNQSPIFFKFFLESRKL
jgi:hypothetical protein